MIRQAHTYLAGAVSGTVLIAIAVAIFVLLVSVQAAKDWPLAGLVGGGDDAATEVEPAQAIPAVVKAALRGPAAPPPDTAAGTGSRAGGGGAPAAEETGVAVTGTTPGAGG